MRRSDTSDILKRLDAHSLVDVGGKIAQGEIFGSWRVEAYIAKGGSGEVYRVVNEKTSAAAALKVATLEGLSASRLCREADFLEAHASDCFPRLFERGEKNGIPFFVMELLDPLELPRSDDAIAKLLCEVGDAVAVLHRHGFVHRDIKPSNIMMRTGGGGDKRQRAVLIDLGLLKRHEAAERLQGDVSVTIVDGHAVGAGTPRYAAPEQFSGGGLSPAADVHALGILADECFRGKPPAVWERIIEHATSSIPERRYCDVDSLLRAIRRRYWWRNARGTCVAAFVVAAMCAFVCSLWTGGALERWTWYTHSENTTTNDVSDELISVAYKTNRFGMVYPYKRIYQQVTNEVEITHYRLNGKTNVFKRPIVLSPERETWIVGPGMLDAAFECPKGEAKVRLEKCFFNNRTKVHPDRAGIRYKLTKGVYLNFTEHEDIGGRRPFMEMYDGAYNDVRGKGPETSEEYLDSRREESWRELMREF